MNDPVNHPNHYTWHPTGTEAIDISEHFSYNIGNALEYLWRHRHKDLVIQDLKKAVWYIEREIERIRKYEPELLSEEEKDEEADGGAITGSPGRVC